MRIVIVVYVVTMCNFYLAMGSGETIKRIITVSVSKISSRYHFGILFGIEWFREGAGVPFHTDPTEQIGVRHKHH